MITPKRIQLGFAPKGEAAMFKSASSTARKIIITLIAVAGLSTAALPGTALADQSATTPGSSVTGTGWYYRGLHSRGTVTDTAADGHCAYAQVKLVLNGYNEYVYNKGRACGKGTPSSWNNTGLAADVGPILSSYSSSAIQGVYLRACIDNRTWPLQDTCGSWVYVGKYGASSAR
jgi:hypothetical protein